MYLFCFYIEKTGSSPASHAFIRSVSGRTGFIPNPDLPKAGKYAGIIYSCRNDHRKPRFDQGGTAKAFRNGRTIDMTITLVGCSNYKPLYEKHVAFDILNSKAKTTGAKYTSASDYQTLSKVDNINYFACHILK